MRSATLATFRILALIGIVLGGPVLTGCNGGGAGGSAVTLDRLLVTPATASVAPGATRQLTATAVFSDGSTRNATESVTWSSADTAIATVSNAAGNRGLVTGVASGTTQIRASFEGESNSATVTVVELDRVEITPAAPTIAKGTTQQFTATAVFTDGSTDDVTEDATWDSSDDAIAPISAAGLATGADLGVADITATFGGETDTSTLTVSDAVVTRVDVTPTTPSVPKGTAQQLTATAVFSDATTQNVTADAVWGSSNSAIAPVSNADGSEGLVAGNETGASTISADFGGESGSTLVTVTPATITALAVTPSNTSLADGFQRQFTATGTLSDGTTRDVTEEVAWLSTDTAAATVSTTAGNRGLVTGVDPGTTSIVAQSGTVQGSSALTVTNATLSSIGVTPNSVSVALGLDQPFTATGTFSDSSTLDLTEQATWSTSNSAVATVSNAADSKGVAETLATGTTNITATHGAITGSAALTVTDAALVSIEVKPDPATAAATVAKGNDLQLQAIGTFTDDSPPRDITADVTWTSATPAVATVSNAAGDEGLVTGVTEGTSAITAELNGVTGALDLTVTAAVLESIDVTPNVPSVPQGLDQQFTAMGTYSDGAVLDITDSVTWASSDATKATVSNADGSEGLATTLATGTTTVSAALDGVTGMEVLTVTNVQLMSIAITPDDPSIADGLSLDFTATGTYSDDHTENLTTQVTWASANTALFTVSNAAGSKGRVFAGSVGTAALTATLGTVVGTTNVTVTPAVLQSITVSPNFGSLPKNFSRPFTAMGNFSDGSSQDITTQVTWSSFNTAVATASSAAGTQGVVSGVAAGSTNIAASKDGKSGQTLVTITNATLSSIAVTPANQTVTPGTVVNYTATGTFSDSSTLVITTQVTWASSNTQVATISNAAGSQGRATAGGPLPGSTTISAAKTLGGTTVTGTTTLTRSAI